ncbi:MAG: protein kinase [Pirellulaceae bacterium]
MADTQPITPAAKPGPDLSGRRLGDYQLTRRLARGGMADVYLAEQQSLRRQVAFKVLRSDLLAEDETYVRRFHNEAQAAASLVHANIVQIYEVGCIDGVHFIAQEYVSGQNLKQLVTRRGPLTAKLAVRIMWQVAAALFRASSRGITHRDIKPENILLGTSGEVKVADFGLARIAGESVPLNLTQVGVTLGTPLYMSPEQVEGRTLDPRSDLYSLGVTCYEMLTGHPPFTGETALSVAVQHLKSDSPRLEDARPDLPGGLCRVIHKMLAKKPSERFQNAGELLHELRAVTIDGADGDWPTESQEWDSAELMALANARSDATQQLAAVMKTETVVRQRGLRAGWIGLAAVAFFLTGMGLALIGRPASLLEVAADELAGVSEKASAEEQFWYSMGVYTEAAFKAVVEHFPPEENPANEVYAAKARLQLGYMYLEQDRQEEAIAMFRDVTAQDLDSRAKARALIALANIYISRGDRAQSYENLSRLVPLFEEAPPRDWQDWVDQLDNRLLDDFLNNMLRIPLGGRSPSLSREPTGVDNGRGTSKQ